MNDKNLSQIAREKMHLILSLSPPSQNSTDLGHSFSWSPYGKRKRTMGFKLITVVPRITLVYGWPNRSLYANSLYVNNTFNGNNYLGVTRPLDFRGETFQKVFQNDLQ